MSPWLEIAPEVAAALAANGPVVALESTAITHGLPAPLNLETARRLEALVREGGAVPATIAVDGGNVRVGLSDRQLEALARSQGTLKIASGDLAAAAALGKSGATTVSATLSIAARAGIRVFATGGIGGVHPGLPDHLDVSADLGALARHPVAVVAAGAKSILDLPRTLEVLESLAVPVIAYGCDSFPAFYHAESGLHLPHRIDSPEAAARIMAAHWDLGLAGLLIAQPLPQAQSLARQDVEGWVGEARSRAEAKGIAGKALTPFLLAQLAELSGGRTLSANRALLENNAALAARIACAAARLD